MFTTPVFVSLALLMLAGPQDAMSCACCAERGFWWRWQAAVTDDERVNIDASRFSGFFEMEEVWRPAVVATLSDWFFVIQMADRTKPEELLRIKCSSVAAYYHTDTGEGPDGDVVLFKEMALPGVVSAAHDTLTSLVGASATVILQGRGNHCFNPNDLQRWIVKLGNRQWPVAYGSITPPADERRPK